MDVLKLGTNVIPLLENPKNAVTVAIAVAMVLFLIGLAVYFSKKIGDTIKRVVLGLLIVLALVGFVLLKIFVL